jgi:hypothetical protein
MLSFLLLARLAVVVELLLLLVVFMLLPAAMAAAAARDSCNACPGIHRSSSTCQTKKSAATEMHRFTCQAES